MNAEVIDLLSYAITKYENDELDFDDYYQRREFCEEREVELKKPKKRQTKRKQLAFDED